MFILQVPTKSPTSAGYSQVSFEKQFAQGIAFRTVFDTQFSLPNKAISVLENTFRRTSARAMQEPFFSLRQKICSLAKTYANDRTVASFSYQCLADSHVFLRACIDQNIIDERYMTLTVGDVSFNDQRLFNASRDTIHQAVAHGISTKDDQQFHVWLTLADMTVIDLTINSQLLDLGLMKPAENAQQLLNVWRPERSGKFSYHPVLIDDEFLLRLQRRSH